MTRRQTSLRASVSGVWIIGSLVALAPLAVGCDAGVSPPMHACSGGDTRVCTCATGAAGIQSCDATGNYGACLCASADAGTQPGTDSGTGHTGSDSGTVPATDGGSAPGTDGGAVVLVDGGRLDAGASGGGDAGPARDAGPSAGCGECATGCCHGSTCVRPSEQTNSMCGGAGGMCSSCGAGSCDPGSGCVTPPTMCTVTAPATPGGAYGDNCTGNTVCLCPSGALTCTGSGTCVDAFTSRTFGVRISAAVAPERDSEGSCWDGVVSCSAPDPYVLLTVNGEAHGNTDAVTDTYSPTWDPPALLRTTFALRDSFSLELWDYDATGSDQIISCPGYLATAENLRARHLPCSVGGGSITAIVTPL